MAWYFAREIEQREHVPVGVIDSTWGGTVAESWARLTALGEDAALNPLFASRGKMLDKAPDTEIPDQGGAAAAGTRPKRRASRFRSSHGIRPWPVGGRACSGTA